MCRSAPKRGALVEQRFVISSELLLFMEVRPPHSRQPSFRCRWTIGRVGSLSSRQRVFAHNCGAIDRPLRCRIQLPIRALRRRGLMHYEPPCARTVAGRPTPVVVGCEVVHRNGSSAGLRIRESKLCMQMHNLCTQERASALSTNVGICLLGFRDSSLVAISPSCLFVRVCQRTWHSHCNRCCRTTRERGNHVEGNP